MADDPRLIGFDLPRPAPPAGRRSSRFDDARRLAGAEQAARDPGPRNPFDLTTAFGRLKRLLALEGQSGPRQDVPDRGYYLNILV